MSDATMAALEKAIIDHVNDTDSVGCDGVMITDWFVGYNHTHFHEGERCHNIDYIASDTTPNGSIGAGDLAVKMAQHDVVFGNAESG